MAKLIFTLYKVHKAISSTSLEVDAVLMTSNNKILVEDGRCTLGSVEKNYIGERDSLGVEADRQSVNFVKLDGNVGCMVNGAGLAMATMEIVKLSGGEPANFVDVGGGANTDAVEAGFRVILSDPAVKAIIINIYGGYVRCDRVAAAVIASYKNIGDIKIPLIVRLQGSHAEEGVRIIKESGLKITSDTDLKDVAEKLKNFLI